jgi:hypothetical protein
MYFTEDVDSFGLPELAEDFKTSAKRFQDQGAEKAEVDQVLALFKELKPKIKDNTQKDIDRWKSWDEFKTFVNDLKGVKSKGQEKKEKKEAGAKLVVEDKYWKVYHITSHDAAMLYGSGTKWCITQSGGGYWKDYSSHSEFYFYISKRLSPKSPFYKIALQHDLNDDSYQFWDAGDQSHGHTEREFWDQKKLGGIPFKLPEIPGEHIQAAINSREFIDEQIYNLFSNCAMDTYEDRALDKEIKINGTRMTIREFLNTPNLDVKGNLHLYDTPITSLPNDLKVGGNLDLRGTKVTSLPDGLKVGGSLDLRGTKVKKDDFKKPPGVKGEVLF